MKDKCLLSMWSIFALSSLVPAPLCILGEEHPEPLQRARRRWVWNQLFAPEEYSGVEPLYVGKMHSDIDTGDGSIMYALSGEGAGRVFAVDDSTGDIRAVRRLDREDKAQYQLQARAFERKTGNPLEPNSHFTIIVQDINDNAPMFVGGPHHATVPEMSAIGTPVINLIARDADEPANSEGALVYSVLQGKPFFSVEAKTGIIRVSQPDMDREERQIYFVLIQAKDKGGQQGGLASTATVTVTLADVNDNPPRFAQKHYQMSVSESAPAGSIVGEIRADDQDEGRNAEMHYILADGDGGEDFTISTAPSHQTALIIIKKGLNFENKQSYTLIVEVVNTWPDPRFFSLGPFSDVTTVSISIQDEDEPPAFVSAFYYTEVSEDVAIGSQVALLSARDYDAANDSVIYSVERESDPGQFFYIDFMSGSLVTERRLDREVATWHNITILAREMNNPSQVGSVPVTVKVLNVNDNPPQLEQHDIMVCENIRQGQLVHRLTAFDPDDFGGSQVIRYSMDSVSTSSFSLRDNHNDTADIVALREDFSQKVQSTYKLHILLWDDEPPVQTGTSKLTIHICPCNWEGKVNSCSIKTEAPPRSSKLHTGLLSILACTVASLVIALVLLSWKTRKRRQFSSCKAAHSHEGIMCYDDEGGGEEDTTAFDINAMWPGRVDYAIESSRPATAMYSYLLARLQDADSAPLPPPYDTLSTYAYEGENSPATSLRSFRSESSDSSQDYRYLRHWGPHFHKLAQIYGVSERTNPVISRDYVLNIVMQPNLKK